MSTAVAHAQDKSYSFASKPKVVQSRKKYREPLPDEADATLQQFGNLMWDRRVVRGNTYAQHTLPTHAQPDPIEIQRQQEAKRRSIAKRRAQQQLRPRTPEAVEGRKHTNVQTELYLEELSDRIEEADTECQTDAFLDRPPTPLFVPAKSGADIETQTNENELFDYDIEVKPILEVLVGKTLEQSLLEVSQEEELALLRQQQREYEELRNAELVEQQRLMEQERRHREEKERRMQQQKEALDKERETAAKIAAQTFAHSYLADLVPSVFGTLADYGYFYDPVERDVEQSLLPWLLDDANQQIRQDQLGRSVLDGVLRDVIRARHELYADLLARVAAEMPGAVSVAPPVEQLVEETSLVGERSDLGAAPDGSARAFLAPTVSVDQLPEGLGESDDKDPAPE